MANRMTIRTARAAGRQANGTAIRQIIIKIIARREDKQP